MSVISENNKVLNIRNGEGISQAIAKELKGELKQDVKLNLSVWNKIFDIVKEDKEAAVGHCQYQGGDEDIKDSKNYVVQTGNYELTKTAWEKICNLAKNTLGIAPQVEPDKGDETVVNNEENQEQDAKTPEEKVKTILETAGLNIENESDEFKKDVLSKYNTMISVAETSNQELDEDTIKTRLTNYVKALRFREIEIRAAVDKDDFAYENEERCGAANEAELIEKYKQFGAEYVELYDQDGDKSIDIHELFFRELIDNYKIAGMTPYEAKRMAIEKAGEYEKYSIENQPTDVSGESELFRQAANKISQIDTAEQATTDNKISVNEAGAYLISMAQMCDNKNQIMKSEINGTELGIIYEGYTLDEIKAERGCNDEEAEKTVGFVNRFKNNINFYMPRFK